MLSSDSEYTNVLHSALTHSEMKVMQQNLKGNTAKVHLILKFCTDKHFNFNTSTVGNQDQKMKRLSWYSRSVLVHIYSKPIWPILLGYRGYSGLYVSSWCSVTKLILAYITTIWPILSCWYFSMIAFFPLCLQIHIHPHTEELSLILHIMQREMRKMFKWNNSWRLFWPAQRVSFYLFKKGLLMKHCHKWRLR